MFNCVCHCTHVPACGIRAAAASALAAASCLRGRKPAQAQTPVRFTLDWRFEGPAALFTMALDKGYFKAEGLDVTIDPAPARASRSRASPPAPTTSASAT